MNQSSNGLCPITGNPGVVVRSRKPQELADAYRDMLGKDLPLALREKYFRSQVSELYCRESGLRWYSPCLLADSDLYETLGEQHDWYYEADSWDKKQAREILVEMRVETILEVGCGNGYFIRNLRGAVSRAIGVDFNRSAIDDGRGAGLELYAPEELPNDIGSIDCFCAFQTIEHVEDPVTFLRQYVDVHKPRYVLLSAPCHESLLGVSGDPLAWPPHHATQWSERAFSCLAATAGYTLSRTFRDSLGYQEFLGFAERDPEGQKRVLPFWRPGKLGRIMFEACRMLGFSWARHRHSILVVLERNE